jgi:hypothetical protein
MMFTVQKVIAVAFVAGVLVVGTLVTAQIRS